MRLSFALMLAFVPSVAFSQTDAKKETAKWVLAQEAPTGGFYIAPQNPKVDTAPQPSLRATSAGVRTLKYLGAEIPNKDKHAAFVLKCFDPKTGGFAEPGGKPDVTMTSIGVMAAAELAIPHEKYAKAMDYLKENAKTFEDVRIGAAAVEAWGVKDCPFDLKPWLKIAFEDDNAATTLTGARIFAKEGGARHLGSLYAFELRLGEKFDGNKEFLDAMLDAQRDDGGWCKRDAKSSDLESTYRVMRAVMLLKEKPRNAKKLREFVESHRNKDGGYATKPGDKSNVGGAYYATIITKWLDAMEK